MNVFTDHNTGRPIWEGGPALVFQAFQGISDVLSNLRELLQEVTGRPDIIQTLRPFTVPAAIVLTITVLAVIVLMLPRPPKEVKDWYRRGRFLKQMHEAREEAGDIRPCGDAGLPWGGVMIPSEARHTHFAVFGRTGAGKTIVQRILWQAVLPEMGIDPDRRAVVYDPKLDLVSVLYGMGLRCPIKILCPFDARSAAWDIAADCPDPATATEIAHIIIPEEEGHNRYFPDAARDLLAGVLTSFATESPAVWTLRDVVHAMTQPRYLRQIVARSPHTSRLLTYFDSDRSFSDVNTTIYTKLSGLITIAACWSRASERVSLQDWHDGESILVLGNCEKLRASLDIIYRILFKRLSELILAAPDSDTRRTWLFLDEIRETKKVDGLSRLLTQGRSKGVSVVLGAQGIEGIRDAFGDKVGEELVSQCSQFSFLGLNSAATAEWAIRIIGRYERTEMRNGTSSTEQIVNRETVLPTELLNLPSANPLNGIHGYHINPDIGVWFSELPGDWVSESLLPADPSVPDFIPRPRSHQYLLPWDEYDLARLRLLPESDEHTPPAAPPDNEPPASRLRVVTPIAP